MSTIEIPKLHVPVLRARNRALSINLADSRRRHLLRVPSESVPYATGERVPKLERAIGRGPEDERVVGAKCNI